MCRSQKTRSHLGSEAIQYADRPKRADHELDPGTRLDSVGEIARIGGATYAKRWNPCLQLDGSSSSPSFQDREQAGPIMTNLQLDRPAPAMAPRWQPSAAAV